MLISIITINFNNEVGLRKTLDSFASIKNKGVDLEHVFVDGLSTDMSAEILRDFCSERKNSKLIIEKDNGIFDAMNKGVLNSSGTHVLFINSGDILIHSALDFVVDVDICIFSTIFRFEKNDLFRNVRTISLFWGLPFCHQSVVVRKSLHTLDPFDTETLYADFVFFAKNLRKSSLAIFRAPLSVYDVGGVSDIDSYIKLIDFTKQHKRFFGFQSSLVFVFLLARLCKLKLKIILKRWMY